MLHKDPIRRITLADVLTHPFMTGLPAVPRSLCSLGDNNTHTHNNSYNNHNNYTLSVPTAEPLHYKYDVCLSYRVDR